MGAVAPVSRGEGRSIAHGDVKRHIDMSTVTCLACASWPTTQWACFRLSTCGSAQSPNGYVSGIPVPWPDGSADTALVWSNQVHASNCIASDDAE